MKFKGLEESSFIEWPEKAVAIAYTGGCNFRCPFCQNKDLVTSPKDLPTLEGSEVIDHLSSRRKWLDGLAVTGGEPTLHPSLPSFARKLKEEGFEFGLETNGSKPELLRELIENSLVDRVFLDFKAPLKWEKYRKAIGVDDKGLFQNVKESIHLLQNSNVEHEYRTTVVPTILNEGDLKKIAESLEEGEEFYLQQFVPENTLDPYYERVEPYSEEKLKKIKDELIGQFNFKKCELRNL